MTEEDWLQADRPDALLTVRPGGRSITNRKARLMACGFYRLIWDRIGCDFVRRAVEAAEGRADRAVSQKELAGFRHAPVLGGPDSLDSGLQASLTSLVAAHANPGFIAFYIRHALERRRLRIFDVGDRDGPQAGVVRDVLGNPFRPVAFDPAWRTETAVALARGMYDGRDFGLMPVLADALDDAGCDHPDVLAHCRDQGWGHYEPVTA